MRFFIEGLKLFAIILVLDAIFYMAFGVIPLQADTAGVCYAVGIYTGSKVIRKVHSHMH